MSFRLDILLGLEMLGYHPAFGLFKHEFRLKIKILKYIDPSVTPQIFMYWIHKDLKGYQFFFKKKNFLPFLLDRQSQIELLEFMWSCGLSSLKKGILGKEMVVSI